MEDNIQDIAKMLAALEDIYDSDPNHFEELRAQIIALTISTLPERYQKRARGLQFVIDAELRKHNDPISRMNRMVELLWEQFHEFNAVMNDPISFTAEREKNRKKGKVVRLH